MNFDRLGVMCSAVVMLCSCVTGRPVVSSSAEDLATQAKAWRSLVGEGAARMTRDGAIIFESTQTGVRQLFEASAGQTPRLLAAWPSAMNLVDLSRDEKAVFFAADQGGDELNRFYRLERATGQVTCLTPEPRSRDNGVVPLHRPDRLFFSTRAMDTGATSIASVSTERAEPERVHTAAPEAGFLLDVSPDGEVALFSHFVTHQRQELVRVELATGASTVIYPAAGVAATVGAAAFVADGSRVLVMTDGGGESSFVLALDQQGRELARFAETAPTTAVGEQLAVSVDGRFIAAGFDAGTHHFVRVLDPLTLRPLVELALPLGSGFISGFSADGKSLLVTWSTPEAPATNLAVDLATGRARALRQSRPASAPLSVSREEVRSFDGVVLPVNVLRTHGGTRQPVIVHLHGGPAGSSAIKWSAQARFFVERGYAWVEPNIRGSGGFGRTFEAADDGAKRPDSFKDLDAVRAWLGAQSWADSSRLVVLGESFGGYLVLEELTRQPKAWRAGVDAFGIADFLSFMKTTSGMVRANYIHELGDPQHDRALLERLSPLRAVDRIEAPLFVYAGANDPRVPKTQSDTIVEAVRARGGRVEYMLAQNEGHGIDHLETAVEFDVRVARFLEQALR